MRESVLEDTPARRGGQKEKSRVRTSAHGSEICIHLSSDVDCWSKALRHGCELNESFISFKRGLLRCYIYTHGCCSKSKNRERGGVELTFSPKGLERYDGLKKNCSLFNMYKGKMYSYLTSPEGNTKCSGLTKLREISSTSTVVWSPRAICFCYCKLHVLCVSRYFA